MVRKVLFIAILLFSLLGCSNRNTEEKNLLNEPGNQVEFETLAPVSSIDSKYILKENDVLFVDGTAEVFSLGGIVHPSLNEGEYYRLDASKKEIYSWENSDLVQHTSGVTLRFVTDAEEIHLRVALKNSTLDMLNMSARGSYGFDVYVGSKTEREYCGKPMQYMTDPYGFTDMIELSEETQEVMINLPLYAGIEKVEIGFPNDAGIAKAAERTFGTIVFYGSSITQGACISRPGLSYSNIICRMLDADNMNLGFAGSARGRTRNC